MALVLASNNTSSSHTGPTTGSATTSAFDTTLNFGLHLGSAAGGCSATSSVVGVVAALAYGNRVVGGGGGASASTCSIGCAEAAITILLCVSFVLFSAFASFGSLNFRFGSDVASMCVASCGAAFGVLPAGLLVQTQMFDCVEWYWLRFVSNTQSLCTKNVSYVANKNARPSATLTNMIKNEL